MGKRHKSNSKSKNKKNSKKVEEDSSSQFSSSSLEEEEDAQDEEEEEDVITPLPAPAFSVSSTVASTSASSSKKVVVMHESSDEEEEGNIVPFVCSFTKTELHNEVVKKVKTGAGMYEALQIIGYEKGIVSVCCGLCGWKRSASTNVLKGHFDSCTMINVPVEKRNVTREHFCLLAKENAGAVRDTQAARDGRAPDAKKMKQYTLEELDKRNQAKEKELTKIVAEASLALNWSASQSENPEFRLFIHRVANLNGVSQDCMEKSLGRHRMTTAMDKRAQEVNDEATTEFDIRSVRWGGGFTCDSYTMASGVALLLKSCARWEEKPCQRLLH